MPSNKNNGTIKAPSAATNAAIAGATSVPALLAILIPALIQAGVQLVPLVTALIAARQNITASGPSRPDVTDAELEAIDNTILSLQAQIDAA